MHKYRKLPDSLAEGIKTLTLKELVYDPVLFPHPLPPFLCLEHLSIWIISATFHAAEYGTGPFVVSVLN